MRISLRGRRRAWLAVPVVLVAVAASGVWLLTRDTSAAADPTTVTAATSTMKETVAATGTIAPARSADLDFEVAGTVTAVYVAEGDRVRKGQALARVDDDALVANRTAAAATLTAASTQLDDDEDAGASDTQIAADQAAIVAAEASLTEAKQAVADATLRATIPGTVVALDLTKGDVVGPSSAPSSDGAATTSAVSIVSTGRFVVDATVSTTDVARIKKGLQVEVTPTGVTEPVYGTVTSVGLVAETSSGGAAVFPVTIAVTGKRDDLYAGTSAEASIVVKQVEDVLSVPTMALQTDEDGTFVMKVVDGTAVKTPVETGATYGPATEIVSGVEDGDEIELPDLGTSPRGNNGGGGPMFQQGGPIESGPGGQSVQIGPGEQ